MIYVWLSVTAVLAGAMNAIAGGGTLLTFPSLDAALQAMGVDKIETPTIANITSTVALVPGSMAGAWGFRKEVAACRSWILVLTIPSLVGGALGAWLLIELPPEAFKAVVPWLVLLAVVLFILQPRILGWARKHRPTGPPSVPTKIGVALAQLVIATYGGYFGAGIGILMLSTLGLLDLPGIHAMNGVKTYLAAFINGISVLFFLFSGKIVWPLALLMAVFAIAGGYFGARLSLKLRPAVVRWVVIAIGTACAVYFFRQQS